MWLERVQEMPGAVKVWSFTPGMSCVAHQPNSLILFWFKCLHSKLLFVTHPDCVQPIWNEIIKLGQENGCQLNSYFFLPQNCTSTPHHHWGVGMQLRTPTKRVTGDSIKKTFQCFFSSSNHWKMLFWSTSSNWIKLVRNFVSNHFLENSDFLSRPDYPPFSIPCQFSHILNIHILGGKSNFYLFLLIDHRRSRKPKRVQRH